MSDRKCMWCDHDPACGHDAITTAETTLWYCHANDHSCYEQANAKLVRLTGRSSDDLLARFHKGTRERLL